MAGVAGQNIANTHDQAAEAVISPSNVGQLKRRWSVKTAGDVTATPTVANGTVYFPDMGGMLWAVTSGGHVVWSNPVASYTGIPGDVSRDSPVIDGNELITGDGWDGNKINGTAHVFAVNRTTGALLWSVQVDTDPASIITGSPTLYNGVVYAGVSSYDESDSQDCCTFRGAVVALSAATGQILWKTYTIPSNNNGSDSNLPGYYSGVAVWGTAPVVDPATGLLYVTTGNTYTVPPGVCESPHQKHCQSPDPSDYFDSILALQLSTGAVAWDYPTVTADAFNGACCGPDDDFASSPNLISTTNPVTGNPEQLIGAGQKSGYYWALDPATGDLVWRTKIGPWRGRGRDLLGVGHRRHEHLRRRSRRSQGAVHAPGIRPLRGADGLWRIVDGHGRGHRGDCLADSRSAVRGRYRVRERGQRRRLRRRQQPWR